MGFPGIGWRITDIIVFFTQFRSGCRHRQQAHGHQEHLRMADDYGHIMVYHGVSWNRLAHNGYYRFLRASPAGFARRCALISCSVEPMARHRRTSAMAKASTFAGPPEDRTADGAPTLQQCD